MNYICFTSCYGTSCNQLCPLDNFIGPLKVPFQHIWFSKCQLNKEQYVNSYVTSVHHLPCMSISTVSPPPGRATTPAWRPSPPASGARRPRTEGAAGRSDSAGVRPQLGQCRCQSTARTALWYPSTVRTLKALADIPQGFPSASCSVICAPGY